MKSAAAKAVVFCIAAAALVVLVMQLQRRKTNVGAVVEQQPGRAFPWPKETCLEALDDTTIVLPGAIIHEGEVFSAVFEISDDNTEVGVTLAADGKTFDAITVKLKAGTTMKVHRSCDAMVMAEDGHVRRFRIVSGPSR